MEWLESRAVRPRQARYQAALRPDMKCTIDSKALSNFAATPIPRNLRRGVNPRVETILNQAQFCTEVPAMGSRATSE